MKKLILITLLSASVSAVATVDNQNSVKFSKIEFEEAHDYLCALFEPGELMSIGSVLIPYVSKPQAKVLARQYLEGLAISKNRDIDLSETELACVPRGDQFTELFRELEKIEADLKSFELQTKHLKTIVEQAGQEDDGSFREPYADKKAAGNAEAFIDAAGHLDGSFEEPKYDSRKAGGKALDHLKVQDRTDTGLPSL